MTIVTYVHRPKRARKRKAQAADMPVIVRAGKKAPVAATNGDDRKSAIVTAKNPRRHGSFGDVPDSHDGCGGLAAKAELLTGIAGVNSRPVRKIVLRAE